jgi:hypothetical protein
MFRAVIPDAADGRAKKRGPTTESATIRNDGSERMRKRMEWLCACDAATVAA